MQGGIGEKVDYNLIYGWQCHTIFVMLGRLCLSASPEGLFLICADMTWAEVELASLMIGECMANEVSDMTFENMV